MKVVFSPQAIGDLQAYAGYLATKNPAAARRMVRRVLATIDRLAREKFDGPERRLRSGAAVRSWPVYPLRIYYRRTRGTLSVLRVYHQARRPLVGA